MTEVPQGGVKMGHPLFGGSRKRWGRDVSWELSG